MFIELIDLLRCPVDHDESWLVAAFTRMNGRFVIEGKLGCPVCSESYPIVNGVAQFAPVEVAGASETHVSADDTLRLAALLGLTRPGATVVIEGAGSGAAFELAEMTESRVIVLNAPDNFGEAERVGVVTAGERIPLATASVDGVAVTSARSLQDSARVLKPGGRIVSSADTVVAPVFREIARDERNVVGEAIGPLVGLSRQKL